MAETAYYTSYIARERHAIVDAAVIASLETLHMAEVAKRLGDYVASLTAILENITVPTIRYDTIRFDRAREDKTPILAVYPNEALFVKPQELRLHREQRRSLALGFGVKQAEIMMHSYARDRKAEAAPIRMASLKEAAGVLAATMSCASNIDSTIGPVGVQSAPFVLIDASQPARRTPNILIHETIHVHQLHEYPVIMPGAKTRRLYEQDELEAYMVEAETVRAYKETGRWSEFADDTEGEGEFTYAELIDNVRVDVQRNTKNPFEANRRVRSALNLNRIVL